MISFVISLVALMVGYLIYSKFIEYRFGLDNYFTSVVLKTDAVVYYYVQSECQVFYVALYFRKENY